MNDGQILTVKTEIGRMEKRTVLEVGILSAIEEYSKNPDSNNLQELRELVGLHPASQIYAYVHNTQPEENQEENK